MTSEQPNQEADQEYERRFNRVGDRLMVTASKLSDGLYPTYTNPADYVSSAPLRLPAGRATAYRG